jgi:trehalose/maltose hydrolase-like predicted phosphorylase
LFNPLIPENWQSYSFHARFRDVLFEVKVTKDSASINNLSDKPLNLGVSGKEYQIKGSDKLILSLKVDFFS